MSETIELPASGRIGVTVLGGFLGAGKTTVVNALLAAPHGVRIAVLVNDFGSINIDAALIASRDGQAVSLTNGCVCCSIGDDLTAALIALIEAPEPPQHIVIEASGVSDPWRIAQVSLADPALRLSGVVVLVDTPDFLQQHAQSVLRDTLERQILAADWLVLNKCDRASAEQIAQVQACVQALSPQTPLLMSVQASLPWQLVLPEVFDDRHGGDVVLGLAGGREPRAVPERSGAVAPAQDDGGARHQCSLACACVQQRGWLLHAAGKSAAMPEAHAQSFESWSLRPRGVYRAEQLRAWLRALPAGVLRLKGVVRTHEHGWSELHYAGRHGSCRAWPRSSQAGVTDSAVVAIGVRGELPVEALAQWWAACAQQVQGEQE